MLTCDETSFRLHGKKFHIYSGAMHYFRILPQYWEDRLQKLKEKTGYSIRVPKESVLLCLCELFSRQEELHKEA